MTSRNRLGLAAVMVLVAGSVAVVTPKESTAGYDRFKTVGRDEVKGGNDITVIADIETGCMYGQTEDAYGSHQTFVLAGQPKCGTGEGN